MALERRLPETKNFTIGGTGAHPGRCGLPGHIQFLVKGLPWDGSNLVKASIHQTTAIVASLVTIYSVKPSLGFSQDRNTFFRFAGGQANSSVPVNQTPYHEINSKNEAPN
jgi:hypothetical protein